MTESDEESTLWFHPISGKPWLGSSKGLTLVSSRMEADSKEIGGCLRRWPEVVRRDLRGLGFRCQQFRWMGTHFLSTFTLCTCIGGPHTHITYTYDL